MFCLRNKKNVVQFHTLNWRPELPMRNYMYNEKHRVKISRGGCGLEPHRHHCIVVLEQDTFILA